MEFTSDILPLNSIILQELKSAINNLSAKKNIKDNLLKRVDKLEKKQELIKLLENVTAGIMKKSEKGKIPDADAEELIILLGKIEELL